MSTENAYRHGVDPCGNDIPKTYAETIVWLERENAKLKAAIALGQENCDAEYERLREERDEALEDTKRLDWLTSQTFFSMRSRHPSDGCTWIAADEIQTTRKNLRAAIDAARKGQP